MGHLKSLLRAVLPNPFIGTLKKLPNQARICFFWNRGLGDIALEIYPLLKLTRQIIPNALITIITRKDLFEGFRLLDPDIKILFSDTLQRKQSEDYTKIFENLGIQSSDFDYIFYKPDPRYWAKTITKNLICKLRWDNQYLSAQELKTTKPIAVLHLHSETVYGFEKNLPKETWDTIISDLQAKGYYTIACGHSKDFGDFLVDLDLRGKTSLFEFLSLMITYQGLFIGPDSGLLNMLYYLDIDLPWYLISFWSNTDVGLLRQNTPSPNPSLNHEIIIAKGGALKKVTPLEICEKISDVSFLKMLFIRDKPLTLASALKLKNELNDAKASLEDLDFYQPQQLCDPQNPQITHNDEGFEIDPRVVPILLAGGHGTRLGSTHPKALFDISGRSLISYFCEKIHKASIALNRDLKAYMIVSEDAYSSIHSHLETHGYFGLNPLQLTLLIQNQLPFVTEDDLFVLKSEDKLYRGPNGNGDIFKTLHKNHVFENLDCDCLGFEIIPIDNPLAPMFCKLHAQSFESGYEASILAIEAKEHEKTLGKVACDQSRITIIEYTQNPPAHLNIANTGLLGFSLDFAKKQSQVTLPVHIALKNYTCFTGKDFEILRLKKFETFIFDHLKWAKNIKVFTASKTLIFQPLKEKEGPYGISALEKALALQLV